MESRLGDDMKLLGKRIIQVKSLDSWIPIMFTGDWHKGARACDKEALDAALKWARRRKALVVGMGDYGNFILPGDKRYDPREVDPDFHEYLRSGEYGMKVSEDIIESAKQITNWLFMLSGNHEEKYDRNNDQQVVKNIAKALKTKYGGYAAAMSLRFVAGAKRATFKVVASHGFGSATTRAGRVRKMEQFEASIEGADLCVVGHMHDKHTFKIPHVGVNEDCTALFDSPTRVLCAGSFLKTIGEGFATYSEMKGYQTVPIGSPVVWLQPSTRKTRVED